MECLFLVLILVMIFGYTISCWYLSAEEDSLAAISSQTGVLIIVIVINKIEIFS